MTWGRTPSLIQLGQQVRDTADPHAAAELADRLLASQSPPESFTRFVQRIPGVQGHMTSAAFDVLCDAWDAGLARREIQALPEAA